jgi:HSP20 family protein
MALFSLSSEFDPVNALLSLQREMERAFERPFLGLDVGLSGRGAFPAVNVFRDREGDYVVRFEVPGVAPESITVETHGRTLTVSGTRDAAPRDGGSFHRRERTGGEFSRSFQLPDDLDHERAEASCTHGVLTVRVPRRAEAKPRQISVKAA